MTCKVTSSVINHKLLVLVFTVTSLIGCASSSYLGDVEESFVDYNYTIAPGDRLDVFVWRNPDVSVRNIPVMPDGRISTPLAGEIVASGKTPMQLARDVEEILSAVIQNPYVTVTVVSIVGGYSQQVRVVGEAAQPSAIPYRAGMTLLDVMIAVGGLTEFSAGNRAYIVRNVNGQQRRIDVKLENLIRRGDITANTSVSPGDILIIPESLF